MIRKYMTGMICGALLTAYTGYVLMDTFVLKDVYTSEITDAGITDVFASLEDSMEADADDAVEQEGSSGSAQTETSSHKHRRSTQKDSSASVQEEDTSSSASVESQETSYSDENINITLTEYSAYDTAIYAERCEIRLLLFL